MKRMQAFLSIRPLIAALAMALAAHVAVADDAVAAGKTAPAARAAKRQSAAPPAGQPRPADVDYAEQPGALVYQVLLAEIALQRGDVLLASRAYADLALRTRDPKVFERSVEVAAYARRYDLALEMARRWLEVEPDAKRAQQLLVGAMIQSNQLDELAPYLVRLLEIDRAELPANLLGLNRMFVRNPDRLGVFRLIEKVCRPFFGIAEAHYAIAVAAGAAGVTERALAETQRALELRPGWEMVALFRAQLLARTSQAEAVAFMQDFVERYPQAHDVELVLARTLLGEKRYGEAGRHFDKLVVEYPGRGEVVYPAAMLALQRNETARAESLLKELLRADGPDKNLAYFYLGQIAEDGKRDAEAAAYYAQVGAGEQYVPAQVRGARLLAAQGRADEARRGLQAAQAAHPEARIQLLIAEASLLREAKRTQEAFELLDRELATTPEQPDLLYESALLAERLGRLDVLETRLRKLIALRPDSAQAYNALGYSFAERGIRLTEARELIEKALSLSPDDGFILDSLGWVLYRQGDYAGALTALERAYRQRDDAEIAVHLGEVLSALGRNEEARVLLFEAQRRFPDNEALSEAINKFAR